MEYAWRFNMMEFAMPFFIQITRELSSKIDHVKKKTDERDKKIEKDQQAQSSKPLDIVSDMFTNNSGIPMITNQ